MQITTYHDERLLHAEDGIAREIRIAFRIELGNQLAESRRLHHDMQVAWSHVVTAESNQHFANRSLYSVKVISIGLDSLHNMMWSLTSPGMGYGMGTTAR